MSINVEKMVTEANKHIEETGTKSLLPSDLEKIVEYAEEKARSPVYNMTTVHRGTIAYFGYLCGYAAALRHLEYMKKKAKAGE